MQREAVQANARLDQARAALESQKEWLRVALSSIGDGVVTVDRSERVTFANDVAARLLGVAAATLIGARFDEVADITDESGAPEPRSVSAAVHEGRLATFTLATRLVRVDGGSLPILGSASPIRGAAGDVEGAIILIRDATALHRAEEERMARSRLEVAQTIASGLAHDMNNLMMGILGGIEVLRLNLSKAAPAPSSIEIIEDSARRAAELSRKTLEFVGVQSLLTRPVFLNEIAASEIASVAALARSGVAFESRFDPDLWPVEGDRQLLADLARSLLMNALESFAEGGRIAVTTENRTEEGTRFAVLTVEDTGCGMAPDVLARIAEPFFSTKFLGRGLGFSAASGIARSHGGMIDVTSEKGKGTRVVVKLPASQRR